MVKKMKQKNEKKGKDFNPLKEIDLRNKIVYNRYAGGVIKIG